MHCLSWWYGQNIGLHFHFVSLCGDYTACSESCAHNLVPVQCPRMHLGKFKDCYGILFAAVLCDSLWLMGGCQLIFSFSIDFPLPNALYWWLRKLTNAKRKTSRVGQLYVSYILHYRRAATSMVYLDRLQLPYSSFFALNMTVCGD